MTRLPVVGAIGCLAERRLFAFPLAAGAGRERCLRLCLAFGGLRFLKASLLGASLRRPARAARNPSLDLIEAPGQAVCPEGNWFGKSVILD
jgi:hypothetical protein